MESTAENLIVQDQTILRQKSLPIDETTYREKMLAEVQQIIVKMEKALATKPEGAGLAAIQIGVPLRVCIIRFKVEASHGRPPRELKLNMVNPTIQEVHDPCVNPGEGCLSLPGVRLDTKRYWQCLVHWIDADTGTRLRAVFTDIEAFIVQHETDHMDGILFPDRKVTATAKVGRNDPCPCGSGKKYKKCCLK